ncbi:unnamed protein product [Lactuca saligna]|uniref:Uncharacterized protein n=1 Tax=Lactuca saligna TaxID=75948 RepID=A0AA35VTT1_LACSI|nr:unnamed protein product [Lactuca saligna]
MSQESISHLILKIKTNIKTELTPILELVLGLPTNAPSAVQVSQVGDKGYGVVGSLKDSKKGAVVVEVILIQISTSLPISLTTTSKITTRRPITKGIIINERDGGSSSSSIPPSSKDDQGDK